MAAVMMALFVVLTVVVMVAMTEKPCCYQEQYEGTLGLVSHVLGSKENKLGAMADYSINYKNKLIATHVQTANVQRRPEGQST